MNNSKRHIESSILKLKELLSHYEENNLDQILKNLEELDLLDYVRRWETTLETEIVRVELYLKKIDPNQDGKFDALYRPMSPEETVRLHNDPDLVDWIFIQRPMYSSILILTYSFFELSLNELCKRFEKFSTIKLADLRGDDGIEKHKLYLSKIWGINIFGSMSSWEEITYFRKIRNAFVHSDGESSYKSLRQYIEKSPGLKLGIVEGDTDVYRIIVIREYCIHVFEQIKIFLKKFSSTLRKLPLLMLLSEIKKSLDQFGVGRERYDTMLNPSVFQKLDSVISHLK